MDPLSCLSLSLVHILSHDFVSRKRWSTLLTRGLTVSCSFSWKYMIVDMAREKSSISPYLNLAKI